MDDIKTAVEFLAERYNYITWMRNRDEISPGTADKWRDKFLKDAKEMEKKQIIDAFESGVSEELICEEERRRGYEYYDDEFKVLNSKK